jgi:transposase
VERPLPGNGHGGCGGRLGETHRWKHRQGAPGRPHYYLLEAHGFETWLVNARDVKHLPGRPKTDKLDSVWLCKVAERQMIRPSFVPPPEIRRLRDLTRYRCDLVEARTAEKQRVEKLLEDAQSKLSVVASDIFGVSGRQMMAALIAGQRDPKVLAQLARGRMRPKISQLEEAVTGYFTDHHSYLLVKMIARIDALNADIAELEDHIEEMVAPFATAVERLDEIPGLGPVAACAALAEAGRRGALLRRAPLRTVHATRRRTRLKQAARALRVLLLRRLEDPPPQPPDVALMDPPVMASQSGTSSGPFTVAVSNLPFGGGGLISVSVQRLTCPRQRPFGPSHEGWYPASYPGSRRRCQP